MRSSISETRKRIELLRGALLSASPARIAECVPGLAEAAVQLEAVERDIREGRLDRGALSAELDLLKRELKAVGRRIGQDAEFYRGWANLLGSATGGYTPSGEAAAIAVPASVSLEG